ncbi:MAG: NifB/NifX family molybdenum-iron cluster-binding protein [Geobacteraceae bacterium]|nr:NifB/NifX family molybdenum-iron cluster-binding protein [Geobacteraceae bacterium]
MKIAFASTNGKTIDQRFGETSDFKIWEIGPDQATYCGDRSAITSNHIDDECNTARASAVTGCSIVCSVDISSRALAKIVAQNAFHLKTGTEIPLTEIIEKLQGVMRDNPPPWMRKAMGLTGAV